MPTTKKCLKDLNLLDRFLFAEAMEDPVIMVHLLEIILGKEIVLKYLPQAEKEERTSPLNRFVKLDVWAMDEDYVVYDTETQVLDTGNLPKRSRLYQGVIDSKLLAPGEADFNKLNSVFIIMIMPFDLFGKGLYRYTFRMCCEEIQDLYLQDDATRIFLNTHGRIQEGVSCELVELLHYMEHTTGEISKTCQSERIRDIQERIGAIKSNEEIGVRYMQKWEELVMERQAGREEGKEEGKEEGVRIGEEEKIKKLIEKKLAKNKSLAIIADELEEEEEVIRKLVEQLGFDR